MEISLPVLYHPLHQKPTCWLVGVRKKLRYCHIKWVCKSCIADIVHTLQPVTRRLEIAQSVLLAFEEVSRSVITSLEFSYWAFRIFRACWYCYLTRNQVLLLTRSCKSSVISCKISSMGQWHVTYFVHIRTVLNFRRIYEALTKQSGVECTVATYCSLRNPQDKHLYGSEISTTWLCELPWAKPWYSLTPTVKIIPVPPLPDGISSHRSCEQQ